MRKASIVGVLALLMLPYSAASGTPAPAPAQMAPAPMVVGGGTLLTNGVFFPGTAVYQSGDYVGEPYQIQKGQDIELTNLDEADIANGHKMQSFKRTRRGRPLFQSPRLENPGESALVVTSHLKPGVYDFNCPIHYGMYGLIEVVE
jgi:plastocyanin